VEALVRGLTSGGYPADDARDVLVAVAQGYPAAR
jgi:hypothetical protein